MAFFYRGKHIFFEPSVSGIGEPPFDLFSDVIVPGLMKAAPDANAYVFDPENHNQYDDISASGIVATSYVEPGNASSLPITSPTITRDDPNGRTEYDGADTPYTIGGAVNDTFDQVVITREQTSGKSEANTELIAHSTVGATTTNGGTITLIWNAEGILQST